MPAENSMANHEKVENSGFALLPPKRCLPYLLKAKKRHITTNRLTPMIKSQPVYDVTSVEVVLKNSLIGSPPSIARTTNAIINTSEG